MEKKRRKPAQLYLYSEWGKAPDGEDVKDPAMPGTIIGSVDRATAHRQGYWRGCSWIMLFRDASLDEMLIQDRCSTKLGKGHVGTRKALSAAGHLDTKITLQKKGRRERLPYQSIQHKGAYLELGQECFYETPLPEEIVLAELGYMRNKERHARGTIELNNEHVWIYVGIYPENKHFNFDPREAEGGSWESVEALRDKIKQYATTYQRRRYVTDTLIHGLTFLEKIERQVGGKANLREHIRDMLLREHDNIAQYKRKQFEAIIGTDYE